MADHRHANRHHTPFRDRETRRARTRRRGRTGRGAKRRHAERERLRQADYRHRTKRREKASRSRPSACCPAPYDHLCSLRQLGRLPYDALTRSASTFSTCPITARGRPSSRSGRYKNPMRHAPRSPGSGSSAGSGASSSQFTPASFSGTSSHGGELAAVSLPVRGTGRARASAARRSADRRDSPEWDGTPAREAA